MKKYTSVCALTLVVGACSGSNPFEDNALGTTDPTTTPATDAGAPIVSDRTLPPGTASPAADNSIFRSEPTEGGNDGDGTATNISFDSVADEFTVDGLAFDGDNTYARGTAVSSLAGQYAVYEGDTLSSDAVTGAPITQLTHRAIFGVSASGDTQFAIVRTGSFVNFGFGGFVYQREDSVTLPTEGQAQYTGSAAGLRDFDGRGGLEYTTSDVTINIDFDDFNSATPSSEGGVRGTFSNRRVFDINGADITSDVVANINSTTTASLSRIPDLLFRIGPDVLDGNGEITGTLNSTFVDDAGTTQVYQEGNYYAVLSGDGAEELVGVIAVQGSLEQAGVTARETGGFILLR